MKIDNKLIEKLLGYVEEYSKTGVKLLTLKFVQKSSDILSKLIFYFIFIVILSLFIVLSSVGVAYLIGTFLGTIYFGFLIVASFYGVLGILLALNFAKITSRIRNSIISQMLN